MKENDSYKTPKSNIVMRFLWKAAGGDRFLLERATYSDQVKYMCLGGIVFSTGAMAGLAGGYAFYTIFEPKGSALKYTTDPQTALLAVCFGLIWGLIIFNIDRFIVTSTGKGDGTEAITMDEFKTAIPRIIMGAIIALTISKPVEIRMFKTEIDSKLYEKQLELQKDFEKRTIANFEERLKTVQEDLGKVGNDRQDILSRIKIAEQAYTDNLMGKANGIGAGNGPLSKALKTQVDGLYLELDRFDNINAQKLKDAEKKRNDIIKEKDKALSENIVVANGLDGLLERIKLAHEISGFWISLFITLLFMAIELTPVFFKLMLTKTPYDYLAENRDELLKAQYGIEVKYDFYKDKAGQERHLIINHEAQRLIYEKIKVTEVQNELTNYAVEQYKKREMKKIDENIDDYIKSINSNEESDKQA